MQVVTRGPIMAIWALTKIWGKSSAWTTSVGIAVLMVLILLSVLVLIAFPRQQRFKGTTDAFECDDAGEFDGGCGSFAPTMRKHIKMKFQAENKGLTRPKSLCLSFDVSDEPCHDSGIKWLDPCYLLDWGALDQ